MKSQLTKNIVKTPIFAYLRRSTTNKQEISLENQADNIDLIIKDNRFDKEEIKYFRESRSAYDGIKQKNGKTIRKRTEFTELLKAIDVSKNSCIILVRESSRLSRNEVDSIEIQKRLFGIYGSKIKIDKIIFYGGNYWDSKSDREKVSQELLNNYHSSIITGRNSGNGVIAQLRRGYFVYNTPKGLSKDPIGEKIYLKQNEKMPFVIRAFEMKTEGKTHKEISKYLKQYGNIKIGERDLTDRLFKNTVYIGQYTYKGTGEVFDNLLFKEGKPPISFSLWDKVQKCLNRKISQYGEKQEGDIIAEKFRTESGKRMSRYGGKYKQYKNTLEKIHISEIEILNIFILTISIILHGLMNEKYNILGKEIKENIKIEQYKAGLSIFDIIKNTPNFSFESLTKGEQAILSKGLNKDNYSYDNIVDIGIEFFGYIIKERTKKSVKKRAKEVINKESNDIMKDSFLLFADNIKKSPYLTINKNDKEIKEKNIKKLIKQKEEIELEKKNYRREALKMGYSREEIEETTKDMENNIKYIEEQIMEFSDNIDMEKYLDRLPEILAKTFELASNTVIKAENERMKEDILKLLELTTVELTISNKKELKVKLFDVLEKLVSSDKSSLEAPSGVEPLYKALQASA